MEGFGFGIEFAGDEGESSRALCCCWLIVDVREGVVDCVCERHFGVRGGWTGAESLGEKAEKCFDAGCGRGARLV